MGSSKDCIPKKKHGKNELMLLATSEGQVDVSRPNYRGKQQDVYIKGEIVDNYIEENDVHEQSPSQVSVIFQDIDNSVNIAILLLR